MDELDELRRAFDGLDLTTVVATALGAFFGGLAAAVAAFGGSVWIERKREKRAERRDVRARTDRQLERRRTQIASGKHVLLELKDLLRPVLSLLERDAWPGPVRFSRAAWLESRPVLADPLSLDALLDIDRAYWEVERLIGAIDDGPDEMIDMALRDDKKWLRTVRSELDEGMDKLHEMIAAFETEEAHAGG